MKIREESFKKRLRKYSSNQGSNKNCNLVKDYKNRLKFRKMISRYRRPKAPHNTTSFIIQSRTCEHELEKNLKEIIKADKDIKKDFSIEDFIITGGSMKGIFLIK